MAEKFFTQADYSALTGALDEAMDLLISFGKSEAEARHWLNDFVTGHYFTVWREINAGPRT